MSPPLHKHHHYHSSKGWTYYLLIIGLFLLSYTFFLYNLYSHTRQLEIAIEERQNQGQPTAVQQLTQPLKSQEQVKDPKGRFKAQQFIQDQSSSVFKPLPDLGRDFNKRPVTIRPTGGDEKLKTCAVPCEYKVGQSPDAYDADMLSSVLQTMESAVYYPATDVDAAHGAGYKWVMTPRLSSDVPVGYFSWAEYGFMDAAEEKTASHDAIAVISNCAANSFRMEAIERMEKLGIKVDKYGSCFSRRLNGDKVKSLRSYKFTLAFENSIEEDYVTEKYFHALVAGSIPVVIGAPNIKDFEPMDGSIIHIPTLEDVDTAVNRMKHLLNDDAEYDKMLEWKKKGPSDKFLALVDMAVVHSACRLCLAAGSEYYQKMQFNKDMCHSGKYRRVLIRERGRFEFDALTIDTEAVKTADAFNEALLTHFRAKHHKAIWYKERTDFHNSAIELKLYRVHPAFITQRKALYEDVAIDSVDKLRALFDRNCPFLEVIFV